MPPSVSSDKPRRFIRELKPRVHLCGHWHQPGTSLLPSDPGCASYQLNDQWLLRTGYAYDQSPSTSDADVLPTMPDNDRQWLSVGANWKLGARNSLDFAYSYIFVRDRAVNRSYDSSTTADRPLGTPSPNLATGGTSNGVVQGVFRSHAQILGVQLNHQF